jgi:hypothetical protein
MNVEIVLTQEEIDRLQVGGPVSRSVRGGVVTINLRDEDVRKAEPKKHA